MNKVYKINSKTKGNSSDEILFFTKKDDIELPKSLIENKMVFAKFHNKYLFYKKINENEDEIGVCSECFFYDRKYVCGEICKWGHYFIEVPEYQVLFGGENNENI